MAAVTAGAEHDLCTRLAELEEGGEVRRGDGAWEGISSLIQINGMIFMLDTDHLTLIRHTINLGPLSLLHPCHLLSFVYCFFLSDSLDPL